MIQFFNASVHGMRKMYGLFEGLFETHYWNGLTPPSGYYKSDEGSQNSEDRQTPDGEYRYQNLKPVI
jgi:hypothetical protein